MVSVYQMWALLVSSTRTQLDQPRGSAEPRRLSAGCHGSKPSILNLSQRLDGAGGAVGKAGAR